jgi:hypothetical protein
VTGRLFERVHSSFADSRLGFVRVELPGQRPSRHDRVDPELPHLGARIVHSKLPGCRDKPVRRTLPVACRQKCASSDASQSARICSGQTQSMVGYGSIIKGKVCRSWLLAEMSVARHYFLCAGFRFASGTRSSYFVSIRNVRHLRCWPGRGASCQVNKER